MSVKRNTLSNPFPTHSSDFSGCDIGAAEEDMEDLKACLDTVKDDLISL